MTYALIMPSHDSDPANSVSVQDYLSLFANNLLQRYDEIHRFEAQPYYKFLFCLIVHACDIHLQPITAWNNFHDEQLEAAAQRQKIQLNPVPLRYPAPYTKTVWADFRRRLGANIYDTRGKAMHEDLPRVLEALAAGAAIFQPRK